VHNPIATTMAARWPGLCAGPRLTIERSSRTRSWWCSRCCAYRGPRQQPAAGRRQKRQRPQPGRGSDGVGGKLLRFHVRTAHWNENCSGYALSRFIIEKSHLEFSRRTTTGGHRGIPRADCVRRARQLKSAKTL